jgi:hypothetical protein
MLKILIRYCYYPLGLNKKLHQEIKKNLKIRNGIHCLQNKVSIPRSHLKKPALEHGNNGCKKF